MTIYEPQITWYGSIIHRITGAGLATGKYCLEWMWMLLVQLMQGSSMQKVGNSRELASPGLEAIKTEEGICEKCSKRRR